MSEMGKIAAVLIGIVVLLAMMSFADKVTEDDREEHEEDEE